MSVRQCLPDWLPVIPGHLTRPLCYGTFGSTIAKARRRRGWIQADLATRASVSRNYISIIERDQASNLSISILVRVADMLGLDRVMLFRLYVLASVAASGDEVSKC